MYYIFLKCFGVRQFFSVFMIISKYSFDVGENNLFFLNQVYCVFRPNEFTFFHLCVYRIKVCPCWLRLNLETLRTCKVSWKCFKNPDI